MILDKDDITGALLHDLAHKIRYKVDAALRPYDLTRISWHALGIIARNKDLSQSDLAEELELGAATVGKLVDRLVEKKLVVRLPDPSDRRVYRLRATPRARGLLRKVDPVGRALKEEMLKELGPKEREKLKDLLLKLKMGLVKSDNPAEHKGRHCK
jgi:DNA-binding MarR family transcriptional regulator